MQNLSADQGAIAGQIWGGNGDTTTNKLDFGSSTWVAGTTGVTHDFLQSEVNETNETQKFTMLRTTLPKNGTYTSNLVIDFALTNA